MHGGDSVLPFAVTAAARVGGSSQTEGRVLQVRPVVDSSFWHVFR